jgi:ligand-binding sensor domain-containing protein
VARQPLSPAPTPQLVALNIGAEAVQSWSNPNDITTLLHDGTFLWAATEGGLVRWTPASGEAQLYTRREGLPSQAIQGIAQDSDGHIWVGYADHPAWSEYDGQTWRTYPTREEALKARHAAMLRARRFDARLWYARPEGEWVWLPTSAGGVAAYDGSRWRTYNQSDGLPGRISRVAVAPNGRLWALGDKLGTATESDRRWEVAGSFSELAEGARITDVCPDSTDGLWLAFAGEGEGEGGVNCWHHPSRRWIAYRHRLNAMIPPHVHSVDVDAQNTIWLAGEGGIAQKRPGEPWRMALSAALTVQSWERDAQGTYWLGTALGLAALNADGATWRGPLQLPSPLLDNAITGLAMDGQKRLWIGTSKGASVVDSSGATRIVITAAVLCLNADAAGQVWAGTRDGLYTIAADGTRQRVLEKAVALVAFDSARRPWAYTEEGELWRAEGGGWRRVHNIMALASAPLRDMVVMDDGSLWLATAKGLGQLSPQGQYTLLPTENGFPPQDIRALVLGAEKALWVGGATELDRRATSGAWLRLTTTSTEGGLRAQDTLALRADSEGTLWVITSAGLSVRTIKTEWAYYDLPGTRTLWVESPGVVWLGTRGGLYRLKREALHVVP